MACPYFLPTERFEEGGWPHPPRLPLGGGWRGLCTAPGNETILPSDDELRNFCNLGYARECKHFPDSPGFEAVRFSIARDRDQRIHVYYVCERDHSPAGHGMLEFDCGAREWAIPHPDARIQCMADCYLQSYLARRQDLSMPTRAASRA